jgi:hypothetical protein
VLARYWVAVVLLARAINVLAALAYIVSPWLKLVMFVPPEVTPIGVAAEPQVPVVIVPILAKEDNVPTALLTRVPETGNVTDVVLLKVKVELYAPDNVRPPAVEMLPPKVQYKHRC